MKDRSKKVRTHFFRVVGNSGMCIYRARRRGCFCSKLKRRFFSFTQMESDFRCLSKNIAEVVCMSQQGYLPQIKCTATFAFAMFFSSFFFEN